MIILSGLFKSNSLKIIVCIFSATTCSYPTDDSAAFSEHSLVIGMAEILLVI